MFQLYWNIQGLHQWDDCALGVTYCLEIWINYSSSCQCLDLSLLDGCFPLYFLFPLLPFVCCVLWLSREYPLALGTEHLVSQIASVPASRCCPSVELKFWLCSWPIKFSILAWPLMVWMASTRGVRGEKGELNLCLVIMGKVGVDISWGSGCCPGLWWRGTFCRVLDYY